MEPWESITAERLHLADLLDTLTDEQWSTPSLCSGWRVRDVAGHLIQPISTRFLLARFALDMIVERGSFDRVNQRATARCATRPTADLVATLRRHASSRFVAPTMPPVASLAEILVHGQDIRVPLGVDDPGPVERWTAALDFLLTPAARRGFVTRGLPAVRWVASDAAWSGGGGPGGEGPEVTGPASAIGLVIMGRWAGLGRLAGDGVAVLTARRGG